MPWTLAKTPLLITLAMGAIAITSCDRSGGASSGAQKMASSNTDPKYQPSIVALGDNCKDTGVATSIMGFAARIALQVQNATDATHAFGYIPATAGSTITLNFAEAVFSSSQEGAFSFELILRNKSDCENAKKNGSTANCQLNNGPTQDAQIFDIRKKISFVVSSSLGDLLQAGSLGTGQNNIVSDIVNQKGLIGFLSKTGILSGLGGGGGTLSNLSTVIGSANQANDQLNNLRAQLKQPEAGCSAQSQQSMGNVTPTTQLAE